MTSTSSIGPAVTVLTRDDISIATRAADKFTQLYYTTYDSPSRLADLPNFYRPVSSLTWNGKPLQGPDGLRSLIEKMPPTKHEMQSFDCHPIPGSSSDLRNVNCILTTRILGATPPSLLVTVSGTVVHGKPAPHAPGQRSKSVEGQARVYSQTFMLVPDSAAAPSQPGEPAKYYIGADALRFVG